MAENNSIQARRQAAVQFLQLVVAGNIDEAFTKYVDMDGTHHNPFFPAGLPALKSAMTENHLQFPNKKITVKHVLVDDNLVVVHSQLMVTPGKDQMIVMHLFRFLSDKITEFWDCGQSVPKDSPNTDGAF